MRQVFDDHRKRPPLRFQHVAGREVVPQSGDIKRRRHHDQPQVRTDGSLQLQRPGEADVAVQVPFVKLVEHQRADSAQRRVERHLPQENAFRDIPDLRGLRHAGFEPDLVADRRAKRRAHLFGHAFGQQARRQPPRLQHYHLARIQKSMTEQDLRQLCRLAGTRRGSHDEPPCHPQAGDDRGFQFIDGQIA